MSDFRVPPLVVDYNHLWLAADVLGEEDPKDWAWRAAGQLLARRQFAELRTPTGEKRLVAVMEQAAALARTPPGANMGFILVPSPEDAVVGIAVFSPVDLAGRDSDEAWTELLEQLAPKIPGDFPPEISVMATKAGECRRLLQRYPAGEGPERQIGLHAYYVWVFEEYGAAVIMLMSFTSLLKAARWVPALDQLAADTWLQTSPGEGRGGLIPQGDDVIEIRPVRPEGKLYAPERATVEKWRLVADPGSGTLTLSGEGTLGHREPRVFPLPGTGRADEVTAVCLATYRWVINGRTGATWRMLLLDREGRVAGAGMPRNHPRVLAFFPPEVFEPLEAVGIRIVSEWYDTPQALEAAHPSGATTVALTGTRQARVALIGLLSALVILIVVGVTVYLTSSH